MEIAPIDRLNESQRECLRGVLRHESSKQIGRRLGISPHTVDWRIKAACQILGASGRVEAARLLALHEGADLHQSLIYQASEYPAPADAAIPAPPAIGERPAEASPLRELREHQAVYDVAPADPVRILGIPFPTDRGERHDLGLWPTLLRIFAGAVLSALAFGALLAGIAAVQQLRL
jgi:DNA-binding CsgD family transcriptional regulator